MDFKQIRKDHNSYQAETFSADLFEVNWFPSLFTMNMPEISHPLKKEEASGELGILLHSLEDFVEAKVKNKVVPSVKFSGGEVKLRDDQYFSFENEPGFETAFAGQAKRVLFISKKLTEENAEALNLLKKMIMAMRLKENEVEINFSLVDDEKGLRNFYLLVEQFRPELVISLGGRTSQIILQSEERLNSIHGKIFERILVANDQEIKTKVMPIFHPDYLLVNPNMKKTTWTDLQEAMRLLDIDFTTNN